MLVLVLVRSAAALLLSAASLSPAGAAQGAAGLAWDGRRAEHLWNRAGFGASTREVERTVALGPQAAVEELLDAAGWIEEPFYARKRADGDLGRYLRQLPEDEREMRERELREDDREQVSDFLDWWVGRMLAGEQPLRERMVLFWHGHFTSSMQAVRSSYEMIRQNQLFRRHALGSFAELLQGVARDPAMLVYLDNVSSRKAHPNENFARELLELYTLGDGNYTEEDVREVARAFTGWSQKNGRFHFDADRHDRGKKLVLGVEGKLDGADVVAILLAQEACSRHLARALLAYFEGREPDEERLASYAADLRASGYRIDRFLRRLFLDEAFYAPEVMAARVASPLDFLVGSARRVGLAPEPRLLVTGAALLGQKLFFPPSVRGWEHGGAWASGSSLLVRGRLAGLLLGCVSGRELLGVLRAVDDEEAAMTSDEEHMDAPRPGSAEERVKRLPQELRSLARTAPRPRLNLAARLARGAASDEELARALVEECLAVPPSDALVAEVAARLGAPRERPATAPGAGDAGEPPVPEGERLETLLRTLAYEILSLPEAQLD